MQRIIKIGIYALVFLFPWQTRWIFEVGKINGGANEFLTRSFFASDVLLIMLLGLAGFYFWKTKTLKWELLKKQKRVAIIFLLGLFAFLLAEDKALALFFELRLFLAAGFFWLLSRFGNKLKLAAVFVGSLIGPTLLALWQFFTQQTFANKWLGLALHQPAQGGSSVVEIYANGKVVERWLRAYGSFDHPNILGGVLVIGLLVCFWLLLQKWQYRLWLFAAIVVFSAGIFASLSRSAWLGLFLGIVGGSAILFWQKKRIDFRIWVYAAVVTGAVFLLMFLNFQDLVVVRAQGGTRLENLSLDQRALFFAQAKQIIAKSPIIGVGPGNYLPAVLKIDSEQQAWLYQPVHNTFVLVWAELGLLGLGVLVFLLGQAFWRRASKNCLNIALLLALLPIMLFDHWLWSLHFGLLFLALTWALMTGFFGKERV